ncbi:hypothetical protein D3C71_1913770 [compost metagenome]
MAGSPGANEGRRLTSGGGRQISRCSELAGSPAGDALEFAIEVGFGLKTGVQQDLGDALIRVKQSLPGMGYSILVDDPGDALLAHQIDGAGDLLGGNAQFA